MKTSRNANTQQYPELLPNTWISTHAVHGTTAYMISEYWINVLNKEIASLTASTLLRCGIAESVDEEELLNNICDFRTTYQRRPIEINHGGAGFSNMYWLFIVARTIDPEIIIESGVWRGQSTWVLREACPKAEIHAFDISLKNLFVKARDVHYHEQDWSGYKWGVVNSERSLIHFDDHMSQSVRLREAHAWKFRHLLFDDNIPAYQIFKDTPMIIPTIDMIYDPMVKNGCEFKWFNGCKVVSVVLDDDKLEDVKHLVHYWENLPTIDPECRANKSRLGGISKFAYVKLEHRE